MNYRLLVAALGALLMSARGHAMSTLVLQPGMPELPGNSVPALWAQVPDADLVAKDLTVTPAEPYHWVFAPGETVALTTSAETVGRIVLTVWDWERRPVAQREFTAPSTEELRLQVTGRGTYLLTLDRLVGDDCQARLARSFAVCPSNEDRRDLWRQSAFWPGCCSFPGRQHWTNSFGPAHPSGLTEQQAAAMDAELSARLGLVLVRPDLPVTWTAPDGLLDFSRADWAFHAFTSRGFRLALQVGFPGEADWALMPQYQAVTDPKWRYPRREEVVRRFAREVIERYADESAFIEVYNEPDNADFWRGTVDEFIATHHWIAAESRRVAPELPILSGGLCLVDPERTGLVARGIVNAVDAVGYHSHGGVDGLQAALTAMIATHAAAGYRQPVFYNTEMGFANWRLDMERAAAATAVQKLLYCWAHGNRAALLYCSRDISGPRMSAKDWGYLDHFMCPRFTYGAVSAFMDTYGGAAYERTLTETNGLYAYVFRQDARWLVPVFVGSDDPRPVVLETDAATVTLLDPMGNAAPVSPVEGKLAVNAGYYPATLVLEGAAIVRLGDG